jgi:predicted transcriptional regulator of viral defense system
VSHAQRYGKASVAKRVGYALEMAGADAEAFAPLRELAVKGYRLLDPTRPPRGATIDRWQLRDNLRGGTPG